MNNQKNEALNAVEEAIEAVVNEEKEYAYQLGQSIIDNYSDDTEQYIIKTSFDDRYDFCLTGRLKNEIENALSDFEYLDYNDVGRFIQIIQYEDEEKLEYSVIARILHGYKKYNTGYAPAYTNTYSYAVLSEVEDD